MRRLVDTTLALVRSGDVSHEVAAAQLLAAGVPVAVIGRVLATAKPGPGGPDRAAAGAVAPAGLALLAQAC